MGVGKPLDILHAMAQIATSSPDEFKQIISMLVIKKKDPDPSDYDYTRLINYNVVYIFFITILNYSSFSNISIWFIKCIHHQDFHWKIIQIVMTACSANPRACW